LLSDSVKKKWEQKIQQASEVKKQEIGAEKKKLFPTDIGMLVNDFLVQHFEKIMNYDFTASVEKEFDDIAEGKLTWQGMIQTFYTPFHKDIVKTTEESERVKKDRLLGVEPESKRNLYAKIARFGPILQIGENTDEVKPIYIPLEKNQSIQTITFEEAMHMITSPRLPRKLGQNEDKEIIIGKGRFGPYIKYGDKFISLKSKEPEDDPMLISLPRALKLIADAMDPNKGVVRVLAEDFKMMEGRYGVYIKKEGRNYKIPKEFKNELQTVPLTLILEWISDQDAMNTIKEKNGVAPKKFAKKEPAKKTVQKKKKE
jgi:DNA topoisomerase-1